MKANSQTVIQIQGLNTDMQNQTTKLKSQRKKTRKPARSHTVKSSQQPLSLVEHAVLQKELTEPRWF